MKKRFFCLILICAMALAAVPVQASGTGFSDVPSMAWYETPLRLMLTYTPGIVNGIEDADGVVRFHPDDTVTRGQFLKMLMTAAEGYTADRSRDSIHWAGRYYTIALENNILVADVYTSSDVMFPCTPEALERPITRYEMAAMLTNTCANMLMEKTVVTNGASGNIRDYAQISPQYVTAVEQAYGKGLLTGYTDGNFHGDNGLSRGEAVVVVYRLLWANDRLVPSWASEPEISVVTVVSSRRPVGFESFAEWLQKGHMDSRGNLDAEAKTRLFGSPNKSYFSSSAEAAPYMKTVTIPIWAINKSGEKYPTTLSITVHKLVAEEIQLIFQQIYDDPEQFPIYGGWSVGGARFTDHLRHSWGCAIDINAYYNCECNFRSGGQKLTCGYGWWPSGMDGQTWAGRSASAYHGTMTTASPYSIAPGGSVVKAFADYGWGWGGSGVNDPEAAPTGWSYGYNFDFMHFSVLRDGG